MSTKNFTLNDYSKSDKEIKDAYKLLRKKYPQKKYSDLDKIFDIALKDKSLFPSIRLNENLTYKTYLDKWISRYCQAVDNPPSKRIASPKTTCSDPALKLIVQTAKNLNSEAIDESCRYHNLFMSAENICGNLLEEYINSQIKDYGWIWCQGNSLKAIDFCSEDGSVLLQIKNKNNTENSSSNKIRKGTIIQHWYRLKSKKQAGKHLPVYVWEDLNLIINSNKGRNSGKNCRMNEESYQDFLKDTIKSNNKIITDK